MGVTKDPRLRSYAPISRQDLLRLAQLARLDRKEFFAQHPDWAKLYRSRLVCVALCQGAALHYVDGRTGINDFDVYSFYASHPDRPWYARRLQPFDFGDPRFGQSQVSKPGFKGRRVDLMGRGLPVAQGTDPVAALRDYLRSPRPGTPSELAAKAVVLLEPEQLLGVVVLPLGDAKGAA
jgi:hypothetical protein